jgi:ankyrin repeat protein
MRLPVPRRPSARPLVYPSTSPRREPKRSALRQCGWASSTIDSTDNPKHDRAMPIETEFFEAVKANDASKVASLLTGRRNLVHSVTEHAKTALHWAAEKNALESAHVLIDSGSDLEARTSWGDTPLSWAAAVGSKAVGEFLISKGARGLTVIVAAGLGRLTDVRAFVESGQDLAAQSRFGATVAPDYDHWFPDSAYVLGDVLSDALYAAARNGHTDVVEYLLDQGAKVDAKGVFGGTGLHWAAMHGHLDTVRFLVSRGASLSIRDHRFGGTPAAWAGEGGHEDIAKLL